MNDKDWLADNLKSIIMKCEVSLVLIKTNNHYLLPTVLEDMYALSQDITLEHCVKED